MSRTLRILYIDDDADTRLLLRELLAEDNPKIEVLEAASVEEAIDRWEKAVVDVLFVDNRLGPEEGVDQIGRLRSVWPCPIFVVTGVTDAYLLDRARRNGAQGLLGKDELMKDGARLRKTILRVTGGPV